MIEMKDRRKILSKHVAMAEYGPRMDRMGLPKVEQEKFFRRYDFFEKTAFKTMRGFNKSRSQKNYMLSTEASTKTRPSMYSTGSEFYPEPFPKYANDFKIKTTVGQPIYYRNLSSDAKITGIKLKKLEVQRKLLELQRSVKDWIIYRDKWRKLWEGGDQGPLATSVWEFMKTIRRELLEDKKQHEELVRMTNFLSKQHEQLKINMIALEKKGGYGWIAKTKKDYLPELKSFMKETKSCVDTGVEIENFSDTLVRVYDYDRHNDQHGYHSQIN